MTKTIMTAAAAFGVAASVNASTLYGIGVNNGSASGEAATYSGWNGFAIDNTVTTTTRTITGFNVDGQITNFDITLTSVNGDNIRSVGSGDGFPGGNITNNGFTITISNITNSNVSFEGFTKYAVNNGGDAHTINGVAQTGNTGGQSLTGAPFNMPTSLQYIRTANPDSNGQGIRYADAQFSAVPEPSSSALLGLGGLALILRRRK